MGNIIEDIMSSKESYCSNIYNLSGFKYLVID